MSLQSIILHISNYLFSKDQDRLKKQMVQLVKRNHECGGSPDGFIFDGFYYSNLDPRLRKKGQKGSLDPSLYETVRAYKNELVRIKRDQELVNQGLSLVLLNCKTWQDVRDALPDEMAELVPELKSYSRTREEAFTILNNERAMRQYLELRPLMIIYLMARLVL